MPFYYDYLKKYLFKTLFRIRLFRGKHLSKKTFNKQISSRQLFIAAALIVYCSIFFPKFSHAKTSIETLADLSLEQLMAIEVNSTSFFDISPEKAPGTLYLISQEDIQQSYSSSISDFLEYYVPGVNISRAYSAGSLYSARGIASPSNATTLFMVNGTNMNVSSGTGINTNLNLPLLGDVERIEVLKGPCSIIHGSGSINGFINIIQKNGKDNLGGFAATEFGLNDGLIKTETGYGSASEDIGDIFIYAGAVKSDGFKSTGNKAAIYDNYFPDINSRFSFNWNKNSFNLNAFVQNENIGSTLPSRTYYTQAPPQDTAESLNKEIQNIDAAEYQVAKEIGMTTIAFIPKMDFELTDNETMTIGFPIQYFEYDPSYFSSKPSQLDSELQLKSNFIFKTTRCENHRIAFGGAAFFKQFLSDSTDIYLSNIIDQEDKIINVDADLNWIENSLFFEDNYQLTRNLTLFAGIRYDRVFSPSYKFTTNESFTLLDENSGEIVEVPENYTEKPEVDDYLSVLIPRFGISYNIDDDKTIKFVYQEGYHYPDYITAMKFLTYVGSAEPIVVEEIDSFEFGYYQKLMNNQLMFNCNLYANFFDNTVVLSVDSDEAGIDAITADDKFLSTGFETSLIFNPKPDTKIELSYSFSQPYNMEEDDNINPRLVNISGDVWKAYPEHTVKFNMYKGFMNDKLNLSLGFLFNSGVDTSNDYSQNSNNPDNSNNLDIPDNSDSSSTLQSIYSDLFNHDRFVFNASLSYRFTKNCSLIIKGENIFDSDVPAAGYYYDLQNFEGISLEHPSCTIGLKWKF